MSLFGFSNMGFKTSQHQQQKHPSSKKQRKDLLKNLSIEEDKQQTTL